MVTRPSDELELNWFASRRLKSVQSGVGGVIAPKKVVWSKALMPGGPIIYYDELFSSKFIVSYHFLATKHIQTQNLGKQDT